jgi:DNA replication and repair protein RecF
MRVLEVRLNNFRNYESLNLKLVPGMNLFVGRNAQGKSNLLEAVFLVSTVRSHRTSRDLDMVRFNEKEAAVFLVFEADGDRRTAAVGLGNGSKNVRIDGEQPPRVSDLVGNFRAVIFSPEDLTLVKSGPGERRRFLDIHISQIDHSYLSALAEFQRALKQRNAALKNAFASPESRDMAVAWESTIARLAAEIVYKRHAAVEALIPYARESYHNLVEESGETVELGYKPQVELKNDMDIDTLTECYGEILEEKRRDDFARGSTGVGPHRDELHIMIGDRHSKRYGSQGEQRSAVLSMKLAESFRMKERTGELPVLLLDDVLSELDERRVERLFTQLPEEQQVLITGTERSAFPEKMKAATYKVDKGMVEMPEDNEMTVAE